MININLGVHRHIQNPQTIRNGIRVSRAEAFAMNCALEKDSIRRQAVFAPTGTYEFFVVCKTTWSGHGLVAIGIQPEMLIGLGDGEYQFLPVLPPNSNVPFGVPVQNGNYEIGRILYRDQFEHQGFNNEDAPYRYYQICTRDILAQFPRTQEGLILPMLGLYAIKLSAMHGIRYTVEMATDEIYHLGFVAEPDFSKDDSVFPVPLMPAEIWTQTTPVLNRDWLKLKYNASVDSIQGKLKDVFFLSVKNGAGTLLPISFWRYAGRPFPITLPCPQTAHTPLYNLDRAYESPLYMTEYPEVAEANAECDTPLGSWFGGEELLKYADCTPTNGRKVIYLMLRSEGEDTIKRAYRVMLKMFVRAQQCGNRSFEALDWDNQKTIPYETLLSQAVEHGYLKIEEQSTDFRS